MSRGFTLIELLIVVAIIAILAAIAVPNFLEAQTRAKVSRVKADMRSVATALETYKIDTNHFPRDYVDASDGANGLWPYYLHSSLTTPILYIANAVKMQDIFAVGKQSASNDQIRWRYRYRALTELYLYNINPGRFLGHPLTTPGSIKGRQIHGAYFLSSKGPDGKVTGDLPIGFETSQGMQRQDWLWKLYDPTNGTTSHGEIMRGQSGDINARGYDINVFYVNVHTD